MYKLQSQCNCTTVTRNLFHKHCCR